MKRITALLLIIMLVCILCITAFADETETNTEVTKYVKKNIEVNNVLQYPELPTGCESVALTILLNHLGFPADKMEIVRNYLPKLDFYWVNGQMYGADFRTTFAGNPESEYAYGCYAPCIVTAANNYLLDKRYNAQVYDLTGTDFDTLLKNYIDNDIPVLIWITSSNLHEAFYTDIWNTPGGYQVRWLAYEHCVVLTGYDFENNLIYVSDPLVGNTSYDYNKIKQRYMDLGKQSVYIQKIIEKNGVGLLGDLDGEGVITSADALFVLRLSVGLETQTNENMLLADVDRDGKITSADSLSILRSSVGIMDNKEIGNPVDVNVVGDWTYKTENSFSNLTLHDDGTGFINSDKSISSSLALWSVDGFKLNVKVNGENYIYNIMGNKLVSESDSTIVYYRGTTKKEDLIPEEKETSDEPSK